MFQPSEYQDKRAVLNEILLQQMVGLVQGLIPAIHNAATSNRPSEALMGALGQAQQASQTMLQQFGIGMQALKNKEAERILGPVQFVEGEKYADPALVLEYLKANVGRTYFGTSEKTSAPEGSIGTAGFGKKFKDWLNDLQDFDLVLSKDLKPGFYKDTHSNGVGKDPMPLLVLRRGEELIVVAYRKYASIDVLNLPYVPEDFRWDSHSKFALRGEMYSYRGDLTVAELETLLAEALATQGITTVHQPVLAEVTNGLSQVVESDEAVMDSTSIAAGDDIGAYAENVKPSEFAELEAEADPAVKKAIYNRLSRQYNEAFVANPNEDTYNARLRLSATYYGPGDAFAWSSMDDAEKTAAVERVKALLAGEQ